MISLSRDPREAVRWGAIGSLGDYGDPRAEARIREALVSGDADSTTAATSAISSRYVRHDWKDGRFDDSPVLAAARSDLSLELRFRALEYISDSGKLVKAWLEIGRSRGQKNEGSMVDGFFSRGAGDKSSIPALEDASLNDPDDRVRAAAREALERMKKYEEKERERNARAERRKKR